MEENPFEEMEKKMKKMMEEGVSGCGRSITVKELNGETIVDVGGNVSDEDIEELKRQYPDAEIRVEGEGLEENDDGPLIEVVDDE